jgi:Protein of unknown function (DUF3093)
VSAPETQSEEGTLIYHERLRVPLTWWVLSTLLIASLWLALIESVPGRLPWIVTGLAVAVMVLGFRSYAADITVTHRELRAGRAHIAPAHVGTVVALDEERTRLLAGVDADARAYLLMRPYLSCSVRVDVVDPRDPTPYWLVSSRRPAQLARALQAFRDPIQ